MHLIVLAHPYPQPDSTVKYPLLFVSQHTVGHCQRTIDIIYINAHLARTRPAYYE